MASIFLSYSRDDAAKAKALANALEHAGHEVWWDRQIHAGCRFAEEIETALKKADAVLVMWSRSSVQSAWVQDEAAAGRDSGRLVPVSIDGSEAPLGFRQFQAIDFSSWKGRGKPRNFAPLLEAISARCSLRSDGSQAAPAPRSRPLAKLAVGWKRTVVPLTALGLALIAALLLTPGLTTPFANRWGIAKAAPASLAVLPFRNLAGSDEEYFAEGVAEEILGQLAREPAFRVAGRTSSWMFKDGSADLRTVGRQLDVEYVLEGSVRRAGQDVRVNVALVRASNGMQLWADSYAGNLDDIFQIQQRIGGSVAASLKRQLVHSSLPAAARTTSGEVYSAYVTARGLLRKRQSAKTVLAIELLRRAVQQDPNYAPAWAKLGAAVAMQQTFGASDRRAFAHAQAIQYVRRALEIDPDLAEANAAMAMILGADSPAAAQYALRAAKIDPNDAEIQLQLGQTYGVAGEFRKQMAAYERAAELDPLFRSAAGAITRLAPVMADEEAARRAVKRLQSTRSSDILHIRGHLSLARFDYSKAAEQFSDALRQLEPHSTDRADMHLAEVLRELGYEQQARRLTRFDDDIWRLWQGVTPDIETLRRRNRTCLPITVCSGEATDHDGFFGVLATKLLLNAGRGSELAAIYDSSGLLSLSARHLTDRPAILVSNGPLVALALRGAGRSQEADRLLEVIDRHIGRIMARGPVPNWFYADSAQTWELQGKRELALRSLEKAVDRGWVYGGEMTLRDIGDEPAFKGLRGNPRFERIRQRLRAHMDRERQELQRTKLPEIELPRA